MFTSVEQFINTWKQEMGPAQEDWAQWGMPMPAI